MATPEKRADAAARRRLLDTEPGSRHRIDLELAPLYIGTSISMPVWVLRGKSPGPVLWVSACIHGDEVIGALVVRQLTKTIDPRRLSGTLLAIPAVNLYGLVQQTRYLPDRRDLNRTFPGSAKGSLAARLARRFMRQVVSLSTHGIDLHTAAIHRSNLPQVRANLDDPQTRRMALAFAAPIAIHSSERDGSLRQAASARGIPTLLYEGGEALRHDDEAVAVAVRGVRAVMAQLKMYPLASPPRPTRDVSRRSSWLRAEASGYLVLAARLGQRVRKGQVLGVLHVPDDDDASDGDSPAGGELELHSPADGVVIGRTENPLVTVGDALVHVAQLV